MRTRWIRLICLWDFGGISEQISIVHNESNVAEVYRQVSRSSAERIKRVLEESNAIRRDEYWYVDWNYLPEGDEDHPDNVMARRAGRPEGVQTQHNSGGYVSNDLQNVNWLELRPFEVYSGISTQGLTWTDINSPYNTMDAEHFSLRSNRGE